MILPHIEPIWEPWWKVETRGRAIAALKYCSGLIYFEGENKPFGMQIGNRGLFGPELWRDDSHIYGQGWMASNVEFLRGVLSFEFVLQKTEQAVERLANEPEYELAKLVLHDAIINRELIDCRTAELPKILSDEGIKQTGDGWSV